jgi:transposase
MMAALIAGDRDPKVLAQLARGRRRAKLGVLEEAFGGPSATITGSCWPPCWPASTRAASTSPPSRPRSTRRPAPLAAPVDPLDELSGVGRTAAQVLIAEIGLDMGRFPTPATWPPGPASPPGVTESAGKGNGTAATGHGNP